MNKKKNQMKLFSFWKIQSRLFHPLLAFLYFVFPQDLYGQELELFNLHVYKNESTEVVFTSLSDKYFLNDQPDSLTIPKEALGQIPAQKIGKVDLVGDYRTRFLETLNISNSEKLYLYNFILDTVIVLSIKELLVVAIPNPYIFPEEESIGQYDYMIGFKIPEYVIDKLGPNYLSSFVSIGNKNPFLVGHLKPIQWQRIQPSAIPQELAFDPDSSGHPKHFPGDAHFFSLEGYNYYIQDRLINGTLFGRRIIIYKSSSNEVLYDHFFYYDDGSFPAPLNYIESESHLYQMTGRLFEDRGPVLFGLQEYSFSCPKINLFTEYEDVIYIYCDNRH